MDEAENQSNDMEHKKKNQPIRTTKRKKNPKNEDSVRSLWDNFQHTNVHIIGVPEGEEKEQEIRTLFEKIMKENFLILLKEIHMQVQAAQSPKQDGCKQAHTKTHYN